MGSPDPQCRDGQRPKLSGWMPLATLRAALLAAAAGVGWLGDLLRRMMGRSCRGICGGGKGDPFEVLGLQGGKEGSTLEEATNARRKLALKWHPDRNIGNEEEATKKMQEINAAYNEVQQILSVSSNGVENDDEASESEEENNDTHNRTGNQRSQKKEEKKQKKREYREQQSAEKHMKEEFSRFQKAHRAAQRGAFASSDNAVGGKENVAPRQKGVKNRGTPKGAKKRAKKRAKKEEQKRGQAWEKKRQEYAKEVTPGIAPTAKTRTPFHRLSPEMRCGIKFGSNALVRTPVFTAIRARTLNMLHLGLQAMRKHACDPIPLPEEGVIVTPLMIACYLGDGAAANVIIQQMIGGRWADAVSATTRDGEDCLDLAAEAQDIAGKLYEEAQMELEGTASKKDLERQQKIVEERRKALEEATDLVGRISTLQQHAREKRRKRNIKVYSAISVVGVILPGSFFFYPEIAKKMVALLAFGIVCWAAPAIWVRLRYYAILLEFIIKVICLVIRDVFAK